VKDLRNETFNFTLSYLLIDIDTFMQRLASPDSNVVRAILVILFSGSVKSYFFFWPSERNNKTYTVYYTRTPCLWDPATPPITNNLQYLQNGPFIVSEYINHGIADTDI